MISQADFARVSDRLPFLKRAERKLLDEFLLHSHLARIPAGRDVFIEGDRVDAIALLVSGEVRVYIIGESGREITLYRFGSGESCILSASAILNRQSFPALATVQQEAEAVMIPDDVFREWVSRYDLWRDFTFQLLSQRLLNIMAIVNEVLFQKMDRRLAAFLIKQGSANNPLRMTHQEIAAELGSSREVISRLVEDLAGEGLIQTGRGMIEISDFQALQSLADA